MYPSRVWAMLLTEFCGRPFSVFHVLKRVSCAISEMAEDTKIKRKSESNRQLKRFCIFSRLPFRIAKKRFIAKLREDIAFW
jgi:hypothetical protein